MGVNSSKKLAAKCSFLSKDEQLIVSNSFKLASRNSEKIKEDELTVSPHFALGAPTWLRPIFRNYGAPKWTPACSSTSTTTCSVRASRSCLPWIWSDLLNFLCFAREEPLMKRSKFSSPHWEGTRRSRRTFPTVWWRRWVSFTLVSPSEENEPNKMTRLNDLINKIKKMLTDLSTYLLFTIRDFNTPGGRLYLIFGLFQSAFANFKEIFVKRSKYESQEGFQPLPLVTVSQSLFRFGKRRKIFFWSIFFREWLLSTQQFVLCPIRLLTFVFMIIAHSHINTVTSVHKMSPSTGRNFDVLQQRPQRALNSLV